MLIADLLPYVHLGSYCRAEAIITQARQLGRMSELERAIKAKRITDRIARVAALAQQFFGAASGVDLTSRPTHRPAPPHPMTAVERETAPAQQMELL